MFRVSVLIPDFSVGSLDEIVPQILVAIADLAGCDLCRLDQRDVCRAHVAIHCSFLDLVETGYVA